MNLFCLVSLIGSLNKILARVLVERLKRVMENLIGDTQSAFVRGRCIFDGVVVLNEAIEDAKKKTKKKRLFFKVEFAKAFDSINWDFLLDVKKKMNFPDLWRR